MRIKYNYIYLPPVIQYRTIYVKRGMPAETAGINDKLDKLIEAASNPDLKAKLQDLQKIVNRILGLIGQIPSVGMQRRLMGLVDDIMSMVSKGDVDGALKLAGQTVVMAEKALELCLHIKNNINALANPTYVQGRAATLLKACAESAEAALQGASSLQDLQEISDLTDRAVELKRQLEGLDPSSPDYDMACRELLGIVAGLDALTNDPGMGPDMMAWKRQEGGRVGEAMEQLRGNTKDANSLAQIDALEGALGDVLKAAKEAGGEGGDGAQALRKEVDQILKQAAEGDIGGATRAARGLADKLEQMGKLRKFIGKRLEHVERLSSQLSGPSGEALQRVLDRLKEAVKDAKSPEELAALDRKIEEVLQAGQQLAKAPSGSQMRHPAYVKLLGLARELGQPGEGGPGGPGGPGAPGLGRDGYRSGRPGTGPVGKPVGTRPLPPEDLFGDAPIDGPRARVGSDIGVLDALGKGLADPQDREAACGCAARARARMAGIGSPVEMAMIAMELRRALDAAKALGNGDDVAANRYALDNAFRPEGYAGGSPDGQAPATGSPGLTEPQAPGSPGLTEPQPPTVAEPQAPRAPVAPPRTPGRSPGLTEPGVPGRSEGLVEPGTSKGLVEPGMSKGLVEPGTSKGLVEPGTSKGLVEPPELRNIQIPS